MFQKIHFDVMKLDTISNIMTHGQKFFWSLLLNGIKINFLFIKVWCSESVLILDVTKMSRILEEMKIKTLLPFYQ